MLIKTRGIILKSTKYSETSIISDIYTEQKGLHSYIISGVRSKRSKVSASLMQPMTLVEMVAYYKNEKSLSRIKEIKAAHTFNNIPFDISRGAIGLLMVELTRKTIRESEEQPQLFNFLFDSFQFLDLTDQSVANIHLQFMVDLSTFLGFRPLINPGIDGKAYFDMKEGVFVAELPDHIYFMNQDYSAIMKQFLNSTIQDCASVKMNRTSRNEFLEQLILFYRLQLDNFPGLNAHSILKEIF